MTTMGTWPPDLNIQNTFPLPHLCPEYINPQYFQDHHTLTHNNHNNYNYNHNNNEDSPDPAGRVHPHRHGQWRPPGVLRLQRLQLRGCPGGAQRSRARQWQVIIINTAQWILRGCSAQWEYNITSMSAQDESVSDLDPAEVRHPLRHGGLHGHLHRHLRLHPRTHLPPEVGHGAHS